jgi:hypothetical protein
MLRARAEMVRRPTPRFTARPAEFVDAMQLVEQ